MFRKWPVYGRKSCVYMSDICTFVRLLLHLIRDVILLEYWHCVTRLRTLKTDSSNSNNNKNMGPSNAACEV